MKNITNLEIKRQRVGLIKELSSFDIIEIYKKAALKTKLEIIATIEVLKHTEKNYNEALDLIFKLEKVKDSSGLITQLSRRELDSKVLSSVQRMEMAPKPKPVPKIPIILPKVELSFYSRNKTPILIISSFLFIFLIYLTLNKSSNTTDKESHKQKISTNSTYIQLIPEHDHKFVKTSVNGIPTTFLLDTGATTSTISKSYLKKHIYSGFVNRESNFLRYASYTMASGESIYAEVWQFPSIKIGPKTIYNVEIAVMDDVDDDGFLMGMSTINKLGKTTIDLNNNMIIIQ